MRGPGQEHERGIKEAWNTKNPLGLNGRRKKGKPERVDCAAIR